MHAHGFEIERHTLEFQVFGAVGVNCYFTFFCRSHLYAISKWAALLGQTSIPTVCASIAQACC